jgi:hypothetical protein
MKAVRALPIIVLFIIAMVNLPAFAQWEYEGHTIGYRYGNSDGLAVTNVGNGATVVVWNSAYGNDYDLFAQYIDSAGYARWGDGGMLLFDDDSTHQGHPAVLADGEGGVFVVWVDWRHWPDEGRAIYGQRIDSLGNQLWGQGRRLTTGTRTHRHPDLYDDGHGGFVTVYKSEAPDEDIGAQRADGNGNILWDSTGITLVWAMNDQLVPRTCKASDSTFITCWIDGREIDILDHDIYMQKFDLEGNIYWGGVNAIPAVRWEFGQGYLYDGHDLVADGHGGAIVVWVDGRHWAYNKVLYADRFSPTGQSLWQPNGMQLGDEHIYRALECQALRAGDNFMFTWAGVGTGFQVSYLDVSGNFIWSDPVVLDTMTTRNRVLSDSSSYFYYLTHHVENGELRKKGNKVDTLGNRVWGGLPYVGYYFYHEVIILDGYGGMIVVWKDYGSPVIKMSRIYEDGHVGGDTTTAIDVGEEMSIPRDMVLSQNYPNPFNARTRINLQLASLEPLEIGVYDLLGRKVRSIFEGVPRDYHLDFNIDLSSDEYSSGAYFIVAEQRGQRRIVKSTLLK